eukprot:2382760-Prymnesium_polylepis.1
MVKSKVKAEIQARARTARPHVRPHRTPARARTARAAATIKSGRLRFAASAPLKAAAAPQSRRRAPRPRVIPSGLRETRASAWCDAGAHAGWQALSSFGFQYLTQHYLPKKLREGDWI